MYNELNFIYISNFHRGMRVLYIGVHNFCSYADENANYNYIISVSSTSFWNQRCSIGNIYFPQYGWPEARLNAFSKIEKCLSSQCIIKISMIGLLLIILVIVLLILKVPNLLATTILSIIKL